MPSSHHIARFATVISTLTLGSAFVWSASVDPIWSTYKRCLSQAKTSPERQLCANEAHDALDALGDARGAQKKRSVALRARLPRRTTIVEATIIEKRAPLSTAKRSSRPSPRPSPKPNVVAVRSNMKDTKVMAPSARRRDVHSRTLTARDPHSTFALDVDTGSYTLARRTILRSGALPHRANVRVEEFVNYFTYGYKPPVSGALAVHLEAAPSPFSANPDMLLLRVGVQAKKVTNRTRKPVNLTFLIDVSGSMLSPDRLGLAQKSLRLLLHKLDARDTVSLVTYAGDTRVVLTPTIATRRDVIERAIDRLDAGGGTSMSAGMKLAYAQALRGYKRGSVNRVIVLSDGDANIGGTTHEAILGKIKKHIQDGITLSTIGFGMGNYRDAMMEQLADKGNGNYHYIDSLKEAKRVFGERLNGMLEVVAKDVKVQVEFDPEIVLGYRLLGYENRDIADQDFRNDARDAGEVGAGHQVTALYEIERMPGRVKGALAKVRVRHKEARGSKAKERAYVLQTTAVHAKLAKSSRDLQFAAAVAGFAEVLRGSPRAQTWSLGLVEEVARAAKTPGDAHQEEFLRVVARAKELHAKVK